jgi:hypothetical protein
MFTPLLGVTERDIENKFSFIFSWLARELLALPIFLIAVVGNEITWRGQRYKVMRNGEASVLQSKGYTPHGQFTSLWVAVQLILHIFS